MLRVFKTVFPDFNQVLCYIALFAVGMPVDMMAKMFKVPAKDIEMLSLLVALSASDFRTDAEFLTEVYKVYDKTFTIADHQKLSRAALLAMQGGIQEVCDCPKCVAKRRGATMAAAPGTH